jgi:hypothetical protein
MCSEGQFFEEMNSKSILTVTRADVCWFCSGPLLETLPIKFSRTCTLVQLAIPFTLAFKKPKCSLTKERQKQNLIPTGGLFDSHVYIDAMNSKQETR